MVCTLSTASFTTFRHTAVLLSRLRPVPEVYTTLKAQDTAAIPVDCVATLVTQGHSTPNSRRHVVLIISYSDAHEKRSQSRRHSLSSQCSPVAVTTQTSMLHQTPNLRPLPRVWLTTLVIRVALLLVDRGPSPWPHFRYHPFFGLRSALSSPVSSTKVHVYFPVQSSRPGSSIAAPVTAGGPTALPPLLCYLLAVKIFMVFAQLISSPWINRAEDPECEMPGVTHTERSVMSDVMLCYPKGPSPSWRPALLSNVCRLLSLRHVCGQSALERTAGYALVLFPIGHGHTPSVRNANGCAAARAEAPLDLLAASTAAVECRLLPP